MISALRTVTLLLAALLVAASAAAQDDPLAGSWEGRIDPADLDLRIEVDFEATDDGWTGRLDIPLQGASGLEVRDVTLQGDGTVGFSTPAIPGAPTFRGTLRNGVIEGTFRQGAAEVPFVLTRAPEARPVRPPSEAWLGTWRGVLAPGVVDFVMILELREEGDALAGSLAIPGQGLSDLSLRFPAATGDGVTIEVPALPGNARLGLRLEEGALVGTFQQEDVTFPIAFAPADGEEAADPRRPQTPAPPFPYRSEEVEVDAGDVRLAGTLTIPEGEGPFPAVVLLNGSGAQDRDSTLAGHAPFLVLADRLTREGLAVLRMDDRGVGGSGGDLSQADHAVLAADARAAVRTLAGRDDVDGERIALLGHSEGGMIAPRVAATDDGEVAALVLLATPSVRGDRVLALQNRVALEMEGAGAEEVRAQLAYLQSVGEAVREGDTDEAARLTRERVRVQLEALPEDRAPGEATREGLIEAQVAAVSSPSFAAFLTADPQEWLRRVDVPTLAVYGRHDIQVPAVQNEGPMRAALRLAGVTDATVVTLPGLNHLLQPAPVGGISEYATIRTTTAPEVLDLVSTWLAERLLR